ncbi:MAG: response regulator [Spirochaetota bacterium]|jgi:PAS domain S-box-containing protein|nr:response regulator [Spirochaetota bacterium]
MKSRIIIAEHDEALSEKLKANLAQKGYTVLAVARNGNMALELARTHSPDLLLIDVDLEASFDGLEAAGIICYELATPIIFLTERIYSALVKKAEDLNAYGFIVKSSSFDDLHAMVALALAQNQAKKNLQEQNKKAQSLFTQIGNSISESFDEHEKKVQRLLAQLSIMDSSPYPVLRISRQGAIIYTNQAGFKFLDDMGLDANQHLPTQYTVLIEESIKDNKSRTFNIKTNEITCVMYVIPDPQEDCANFYGRSRIEHNRGNGPLEGSGLRFRSLMEKQSIIACAFSPDGRIEYVNAAFCSFFDRKNDELTGKAFADAVKLSDTASFNATLRSLQEGNQVSKFEQSLEMNTAKHWIEWDCRAVFGSIEGELLEVLATASEISDRKRVVELEKEKEISDGISRMKTEFLSNVSHELRTPVGGILGMSDLLLDTRLSSEQREYSKTIRNSAQALLTIINDLLDYSQIQEGKLKIESNDFDLREAIEDVMRLLAPRASEKNLELILHYSVDSPNKVIGDPGRIRQVLLNLTNNAIKFTIEGHVLLYVDCILQKDGRSTFSLALEDSGIGISNDKLDVIFERFSQADSSTTRFYGGTGLGLTISRQLARGMGGDIGVESSVGVGTTFWFSIPLTLDPAKETPLLSLKSYSHLISLYLVCTHDIVGRIYGRICRESGADCVICDPHDISEQLVHTHVKPMCVVLIDQRINDMDCFVLAKTLRNKFKGNMLKLILLANPDSIFEDIHTKGELLFDSITYKPLFHQPFVSRILSMVFPEDFKDSSAYEEKPLTYLSEDTPSQSANNDDFSEQVLAGVSILVVEDNSVNQMVVFRILERFGAAVTVANHGQEALERLGKRNFDLILMDCQMPIMDGYSATREIRDATSRFYRPDLPIIALTAHRGGEEMERTRVAGMNDYLCKPVQRDVIREKIVYWLKHTRSSGLNASFGAPSVPESDESNMDAGAGKEEIPVFDLPGVMNRLGNDEGLLRELLGVFWDSLDAQLAAMYTGLESGNIAEAEDRAHALKGAASNVGAERLRQRFYALELAGRNKESENFAELVQDLPVLIEELKKTLIERGYHTG